MPITHASASVAVRDVNAAAQWYSLVLDRPANRPMPELAEFHFQGGGALQVYQLAERAGAGSCTLAVTHIEEQAAHVGDEHSNLALFQAETDGEVELDYGRPGVNHFGFEVDDIEDARARVERLGAHVHFAPQYDPGKRIYFLDPSGHEVELVQY